MLCSTTSFQISFPRSCRYQCTNPLLHPSGRLHQMLWTLQQHVTKGVSYMTCKSKYLLQIRHVKSSRCAGVPCIQRDSGGGGVAQWPRNGCGRAGVHGLCHMRASQCRPHARGAAERHTGADVRESLLYNIDSFNIKILVGKVGDGQDAAC